MRKLILLIVVAALIYGGYWFIGRSQIQDRLTEALIQADDGAYEVTYNTLKTRGFPSRFDTTVTDFHFADPATGTEWTAPLFQLLALSYRPNEVIAIFPPEQTFTVNGTEITLQTNDMRASGKVRANAALSFQDATVTMDAPRFITDDGGQLAMANILAATRLTPDTAQTYDIFVEAHAIELPENIRRFIDPGNLQPPLVQALRFDSDATLSAPLELLSPDGDAPTFESLSIKEFAATWGEISLTAIGDIEPNEYGVPSGSVSVSARNWQQGLDLAVANGMVDANRRFLVTEIANNLDETPHIPDTLTLTLTITNGVMSLGGLPLGSVPSLR
ncbi:DUF2125 domain-containing protein [Octadecabacter sp.]|nr:DUF2125 domain-containing protein [Octadecabacter sp.]